MPKPYRVFITGADRGIGRELALRLSRDDVRVFVTGLDAEALKQLASECGNPNAWAVCDVRSGDQIQAAIEQASACMSCIDAVVANAGIARQMTIDDPDLDAELDVTLDVNFRGAVRTARAARPYLAETHGYMLFISSAAGLVNPPLMVPYNVSKNAVRAFAETFRFEVMPEGIDVGVATFTELDTEMTRTGFATVAGDYLLTVTLKMGRKVILQRRILPVAKLEPAIAALANGIKHRRRHIHSPRRVLGLRLFAPFVQRLLIEPFIRPRMAKALKLAHEERGQRTTILPPLDPTG